MSCSRDVSSTQTVRVTSSREHPSLIPTINCQLRFSLISQESINQESKNKSMRDFIKRMRAVIGKRPVPRHLETLLQRSITDDGCMRAASRVLIPSKPTEQTVDRRQTIRRSRNTGPMSNVSASNLNASASMLTATAFAPNATASISNAPASISTRLVPQLISMHLSIRT